MKPERLCTIAMTIIILYALFRFIETIYIFNTLNNSGNNGVDNYFIQAATSFNIYRDFVAVATGLLTLIIGATGAGAYLSFQSFKRKEKKIISSLKRAEKRFLERTNKLEMFLSITEAQITKESDEKGSLSSIELYTTALSKYPNYPLVHVLMGEEYYLMGSSYYNLSIGCFEKALLYDTGKTARAYYGLGQALFQSSISEDIHHDRDISKSNIEEFKLNSLQSRCTDESRVRRAISKMKIAHKKGYEQELTFFELGRMYEALGKHKESLNNYKKSYKAAPNDMTRAFYYCLSRVRNNFDLSDEQDTKETIELLNKICYLGLMNKGLAYALLWYVYTKREGAEDKKALQARKKTNDYEINELFTLSTKSK